MTIKLTKILKEALLEYNKGILMQKQDLPPVISKLIDSELGGNKKPTVTVYVDEVADISSNWHDANYRTMYAVDLNKGVHGSIQGSHASVTVSKQSQAVQSGGEYKLENNQAIVIFNTYPKGNVEVYISPSNINPKMLQAQTGIDLSDEEKIILYVFGSYISAARKDKLGPLPDLQGLFNGLKQKGYINNRNALTFKGKEFHHNMEPEERKRLGKYYNEKFNSYL